MSEAAPYPPYVATPADRERWDMCRAIAEKMFPDDASTVWLATRSLYENDIPTGELDGEPTADVGSAG